MTELMRTDERDQLLHDALAAIAQLEEQLERQQAKFQEPIAVVGMACRFPGGANTPELYWRLLCEGRSAIRYVPEERAELRSVSDRRNADWCGGYIDNVDEFDPEFYGISPREAESMDPQQRLVLELAWEVLERAGIPPLSVSGTRMGVFVGVSTLDYADLIHSRPVEAADFYSATGASVNVIAGRVSFSLNAQGPCMTLDGACASSLMAVHNGCQSLRAGESNLALAGGVNMLLSPHPFLLADKWGMLSKDHRCKTFDAAADGFVRGEGAGLVALKRLSDAIADGDPIHAVIRGSAINNDGRSSGLTVPNGPAQQAVMRQALRAAGVAPADISYVEAHGTGTALGDPIEVEAIGHVLKEGRTADRTLILSSAKTNVGHLEAASGVAGLIKVILCMKHGQIPPHLHLQRRNPNIPWPSFPVEIPTAMADWRPYGETRLAGVSSFGFSGCNAHVVVEGPPQCSAQIAPARSPHHLVTLSAKDRRGLLQAAADAARYIEEHPAATLSEISQTTLRGRSGYPVRLAIVADSLAQLRDALVAAEQDQADIPGATWGTAPANGATATFLFTGQGAPLWRAGKELYAVNPTFRETLDACDARLQDELGISLIQLMHEGDEENPLLQQTRYSQPCLLALELALTKMWQSLGMQPEVVLGHSIGEYAAAVTAGVMSWEDALRLITARGRLMHSAPGRGAMAAVFASADVLEPLLAASGSELVIATHNSPGNCVVSGGAEALEQFLAQLAQQGIKSKRLNVSHGFHSPLMTPILADFRKVAASITYRDPQIPFVSSVTGRLAKPGEVSRAEYWVEHIAKPVRFMQAIESAVELGSDVMLEVGPGTTLVGLGRQCAPQADCVWAPSLRSSMADWQQVLTTLAVSYARGKALDFAPLFDRPVAILSDFPTSPQRRKRYWLAPLSSADAGYSVFSNSAPSVGLHPLIERELHSPALDQRVFESILELDTEHYLTDHRVLNTPIMPGAAMVEMLLFAARQHWPDAQLELRDIQFLEPLWLKQDEPKRVQVLLSDDSAGGSISLKIVGQRAHDNGESNPWRVFVAAQAATVDPDISRAAVDLSAMRDRCSQRLSLDEFYQRLNGDLFLGTTFHVLQEASVGDGESLARVCVADGSAADRQGTLLHPLLLDGCFQTFGSGFLRDSLNFDEFMLPMGIERLRLYADNPPEFWVHATKNDRSGLDADTHSAVMRAIDDQGRVVLELQNFKARVANTNILRGKLAGDLRTDALFKIDWRAAPLKSIGDAKRGAWLVLADEEPASRSLVERLRDAGARVIVLQPSDDFFVVSPDLIRLAPNNPDHFESLATKYLEPLGDNLLGVVDLLCLGQEESRTASLPTQAGEHCQRALALRGLLDRLRGKSAATVLFVTNQAQAIEGFVEPIHPEQAALWGFVRSAMSEDPAREIKLVDVDSLELWGGLTNVAHELATPSPDRQVALRHGGRFVARLVEHSLADGQSTSPGQDEFRLTTAERGRLDRLRWSPEPLAEAPLPADSVRVRVEAAGLNFRDVLNVLGKYPGDPGPLGAEFAGRVLELGSDVDDLQIGDEVFGAWGGALASMVTARRSTLSRKPARLTTCEAASIPSVFLTALYGLRHLAKIQPGQRVLIHAGTGGVGLAAVQIVQAAGAEVFATAGNPFKRAVLKGLGVEHVYDSRTLDFADQVLNDTGGEGVHVVLNSLAGDFITESVRVLATKGCFLEIGKAGVWTNEQMSKVRPDVSYHLFDIGSCMYESPELARRLFAEICADFDSGLLRPLPLHIYPMHEAEAAFRQMAQGKHLGKMVFDMRPTADEKAFELHGDASYLITGGLGGLGLAVAEDFAARGAGQLVLVGRSQPSEETQQVLTRLQDAGCRILVQQADISKLEDVQRVVQQVTATGLPLRGVVHAAGVLDDAPVSQLSWPRCQRVLAPKTAGAWNLHQVTQASPPDFLILFSSVSAILGAPGQAPYAAGNAFMDALAWSRSASGQPALSINWGPWSEAGMASRLDPILLRRMSEQGVRPMSNRDSLQLLARLANARRPQVAVLDLDRAPFHAAAARMGLTAVLDELATSSRSPAKRATQSAATGVRTFADRSANSSPEELDNLVRECLRAQIHSVFHLRAEDLAGGVPSLRDIGLDSLTALELKNRIDAEFGIQFPLEALLTGPSMQSLADDVSEQVRMSSGASPRHAAIAEVELVPSANEIETQLASLNAMSDDEIEALWSQTMSTDDESR